MGFRHLALAAAVLSPVAVPLAAQQAAPAALDGAKLFQQRCVMCHANAPGQKKPLGPNLFGVVGRKAGSADYAYSPAMKGSAIVWDEAKIESYLARPAAMVPGSRMTIAIPDPKQRAALAKYVGTLK